MNIVVLDTEMYSNTGGQVSKSTPQSALVKFATSGKTQAKKDIGQYAMGYEHLPRPSTAFHGLLRPRLTLGVGLARRYAMGYENVYVASCAMGADYSQVTPRWDPTPGWHPTGTPPSPPHPRHPTTPRELSRSRRRPTTSRASSSARAASR